MALMILKRLGTMVLMMLVVSLVIFLLLEVDKESVAIKVLGVFTTEEQRRIWLEAHGYFDPLYVRYFRWLSGFVTGDLGESTVFRVPVSDILWRRLGNTAILGVLAMAVVVPLSLVLGVLAGMREGSLQDRSISVISIITTSVPEFASGIFLVAIFVVGFRLLPGTSGMIDGFKWVELVLPVAVLVIYDFGYVTRMTRASMAEVMMTPYIRTAILKGLPFRRVIVRHALRNALIAPFTVIMLQINWLLSGVIVVELLFAYKGFGTLLLEAALNGDIFVIEAATMVAVFVAVATQTIADVGYTLLNPRIRFT